MKIMKTYTYFHYIFKGNVISLFYEQSNTNRKILFTSLMRLIEKYSGTFPQKQFAFSNYMKFNSVVHIFFTHLF